MSEILLIITAVSLLCSLLLWRLLTAQNNKAQVAYAKHRKEHNDILERTKAERRELRLLLNAFDDAMVITNNDGVIQIENQATKALCKGRSVRGKTVKEAFLNEEICQHIETATSSQEPTKKKLILTSSTFGNHTESNTSAWIIDVAPIPSNEEDPLHRIILKDITAEHRTDQVKREFVANASHELRTPLAIISGYLENLIDDDVVDSPATARRFLTTIRKHSDRLSKLIDEMLTISKLESGEAAQLNKEPFSLNRVLSDITDRLAPMLSTQDSSIQLNFIPENITITGDQFYWEQALFNLIENALKQNHDNPITVSVDMKQDADNLTIDISDNGKGIPSAHLPYIFNRFYRVQKHHSQNEVKGTGLGLSIVKHAIEAHGGTITATSQAGIKTTFSIICPQT